MSEVPLYSSPLLRHSLGGGAYKAIAVLVALKVSLLEPNQGLSPRTVCPHANNQPCYFPEGIHLVSLCLLASSALV